MKKEEIVNEEPTAAIMISDIEHSIVSIENAIFGNEIIYTKRKLSSQINEEQPKSMIYQGMTKIFSGGLNNVSDSETNTETPYYNKYEIVKDSQIDQKAVSITSVSESQEVIVTTNDIGFTKNKTDVKEINNVFRNIGLFR